MRFTHGREGRSSLGRRFAAGMVAAAMTIGGSLAMGTAAYAQEGDTPVAMVQENGSGKHFMVYYRAWRDITMKGVNTDLPDDNWISMYDIPYGIDVVNVFSYVPQGQEEAAQPFYDKLKSDYAPYLHSRGIKLVRGIDYNGVMVDGFTTWIAEQGKSVETATEADYDAYADHVIETYMTSVGLDGLDIDMETHPDESQVAISDQVIRSLSKRIGPRSGDPDGTMFLYDTNGSYTAPFENVADCFDYIAYQQYGSDSTRTAKAAATYEQFIDSTKFVPGLTFPEEGDMNNRWYDAIEPYEESHFYDVASYSYDNNLGGMFVYALDRDGRTYEEDDLTHIKPSNLIWTKTAIAQSQGMSLENAKAAAGHFLDRMSLTKDVPAETRQAVDAATNLYEVNKAVLGGDWDEGYSNTYDPTLELSLTAIDSTALTDAIGKAKELIASGDVTGETLGALRTARDAAVAGLTGKLYTADAVADWASGLVKAIDDSTPVTPEPEKPGDGDQNTTDGNRPNGSGGAETKPTAKPNKPTKKPGDLANTGIDTIPVMLVAAMLMLSGAGALAARRRR
ncbi:endo-beta-N-acetylglucosaminidase [Bifidobacterium samirii]|uniref:mannosyl-glycoprotein endo-beta-N-acetylglucosaminidase n=1 Tax=Bifidobacterium samirii TaxID=2306974 RepID=A0A430FUV1_9BIFI|nr:LPXTG cell wall anchor domain-containing protein [Bifidobacterium samirii]RSX57242.1 glycosyl hydrolase [Bifidobacterium samirii]